MLTKNNIWRFRVLGADGKPVETAPGATAMTVKGPGTKPELLKAAAILLNSKRTDAIAIGLEDPGYRIDEASVEPLGHTDDDTSVGIGTWRPEGAKEIELPTDKAVAEANIKNIRERVGKRESIPE